MMMHAALFALLAASPAFAQDNSGYVPGLLQALNAANLTQLAGAAQNIANTSTGQTLLASLPEGNKTVFAPDNQAWTGNPPHNITDPEVIADILSYHVVSGSFPASSFAKTPAHSILRTQLNASQFVQLEGNKSQVLSISSDNGTVHILQQNTPVKVVSSTTYQNLIIHVTNAVIDIPPTLSTVVASHNLSMLATAANQGGVLQGLESARGVTIFAPNDAAFATALQALGGAGNVNQSTIQTILENHVINGTSAYSTLLSTGNYTSAAGEPFTFGTNSSGTFVSSGPSTARIVESDIIVSNGVVHIIDGVLLNTQSNTAAASAAISSATSVAAQSTSETGGVGGTSGPTSTSGASASQGANGNGGVTLEVPLRQSLIALGLVFGGAALIA